MNDNNTSKASPNRGAKILPVTPAELEWREDRPYARQFDDIYYSDDGSAEIERVFIDPARVRTHLEQPGCTTIAELGFGTGLNFASVAQLVLARRKSNPEMATAGTQLHFISFEAHPLSAQDWRRHCLSRSAEFDIFAELANQPLPLLGGWHRRELADGLICLSVFVGDVASGLDDLLTTLRASPLSQVRLVDCWFLDGFAPSKNPQMWKSGIFESMAELSHDSVSTINSDSASQSVSTANDMATTQTRTIESPPSSQILATTFATFTASGAVRRGLQSVGFEVRKVDQQPFKRESLAGRYTQSATALRRADLSASAPAHKQARVLGAGIGGAVMARHLAQRGMQVEVFDPQGIASCASKIPVALLHARLLGDLSIEADLRIAAFHYASRYLDGFDGFSRTGVLQVEGPNLDQAKIARIARNYGSGASAPNPAQPSQTDLWLEILPASDAYNLSMVSTNGSSLWFPHGGIVDLPTLCRSLLDHPNIQIRNEKLAEFDANVDPTSMRLQIPTILCTGTATREMLNLDWLEITDVHGQVDTYQMKDAPSNEGDSWPLIPIVGNGYLAPHGDGQLTLGASYEYTAWTEDTATQHNAKTHAQTLANQAHNWISRSRGARCVSSDRIPVVGKLANNLYIATAFGSMGTTMAPLAAAIISARILGWAPPVGQTVENAMAPGRFIERQARRGRRPAG